MAFMRFQTAKVYVSFKYERVQYRFALKVQTYSTRHFLKVNHYDLIKYYLNNIELKSGVGLTFSI